MRGAFYRPPHHDPCYEVLADRIGLGYLQGKPHYHHPQALGRYGNAMATAPSTSSDANAANINAAAAELAAQNSGIEAIVREAFSADKDALARRTEAWLAERATNGGGGGGPYPATFTSTVKALYPTPSTATALVLLLAGTSNALSTVEYLVRECGADINGAYLHFYCREADVAAAAASATPLPPFAELGGYVVETLIEYVDGVRQSCTAPNRTIYPNTRAKYEGLTAPPPPAVHTTSTDDHGENNEKKGGSEAFTMTGTAAAHANGAFGGGYSMVNLEQMLLAEKERLGPLHCAAKAGRAEMCGLLIRLAGEGREGIGGGEQTSTANSNNDNNKVDGDAECYNRRVRFINRREGNGRTALHYACRSGGIGVVQTLMSVGGGYAATSSSNRSSTPTDGTTRHPLPPMSTDNSDPTPTSTSSLSFNTSVIDVNAKDWAQGSTALHDAASQGRTDVMTLLMTGQPHAQRYGGVGAAAAAGGGVGGAAGHRNPHPLASAGIPDAQGNTALHVACRMMKMSNRAWLDDFIAASVRPYAAVVGHDDDEDATLGKGANHQEEEAREGQGQQQQQQVLVTRRGVGVNATNLAGLTPLHFAVAEGSHMATQALLEYNRGGCGACNKGLLLPLRTLPVAPSSSPLSDEGSEENTAAAKATCNDDGRRGKYCPTCHCDVNAANNKQRRTPLHCACVDRYPSLSVVLLLLDHGADVAAKDSKGFTPLKCAVKYVRTAPPSSASAVPIMGAPPASTATRVDGSATVASAAAATTVSAAALLETLVCGSGQSSDDAAAADEARKFAELMKPRPRPITVFAALMDYGGQVD